MPTLRRTHAPRSQVSRNAIEGRREQIEGESTLADGAQLPLLGLGVWQVPNGRECVDAVRWALELGYRHIDTAQAYGNEESVGQGLRESGVPRGEVFITTKFHPARRDPVAEVERSLQRLGVDCVDLYIVHWPEGGPTWAWPGMERARGARVTRGRSGSPTSTSTNCGSCSQRRRSRRSSIRCSSVRTSTARLFSTRAARAGSRWRPTARSGHGRHLASETVARIARRHGRTPAQVLLRWCIERGIPVIPKSTHRERIAENAQLFDFRLSDQDIAELDALDRTGGTDRALERKWW